MPGTYSWSFLCVSSDLCAVLCVCCHSGWSCCCWLLLLLSWLWPDVPASPWKTWSSTPGSWSLVSLIGCGALWPHTVLATVTVPRFPGRSYSTPAEEAERRQVWLSNRKLVLVHNMLADQGIKSYRLGMTPFADMVCTSGFSIFVETSCTPRSLF